MKAEKNAITILSITAALLLAAFFWIKPHAAKADLTIKDRDYMVVTGALQQGGDALYITEVRSGQMAIFAYDPVSRSVQAKAIIPLPDIFKS